MNICFAKVALLWPHLFLDTVQNKHATRGEGGDAGEHTDGGGCALIIRSDHIYFFSPTNKTYTTIHIMLACCVA